MIDRAAIFTSLLLRNALRREALLPLLDVRATYDQEVSQSEWRAHIVEHREAAHAKVLCEQRRRHGPNFPRTTAERWLLSISANRALRRSFDARRG